MSGLWEEWSFSYQLWFMIAFALGGLQMLTDEFFFGGACIGAVLTAIVMLSLGDEFDGDRVSVSLPYIMCGAGGLIGATLMRRACRKRQEGPDINDEPYEGDC